MSIVLMCEKYDLNIIKTLKASTEYYFDPTRRRANLMFIPDVGLSYKYQKFIIPILRKFDFSDRFS